MATARALRRHMAGVDGFPQDVVELIGYLGPAEPGAAVRAIPGEGTRVPVWMLGSSLYGAQLAAHLGLPYAFASHFAPDALGAGDRDLPRARSARRRSSPRRISCSRSTCSPADSDAEGVFLKSSMQQAFINLRTGRPGQLPPPVDDIGRRVDPATLAAVEHALVVLARPARPRRFDASSSG